MKTKAQVQNKKVLNEVFKILPHLNIGRLLQVNIENTFEGASSHAVIYVFVLGRPFY